MNVTDKLPPPTVGIDDVAVAEGAGQATFTVSLNNPSDDVVTVREWAPSRMMTTPS